LNNYTTFVCGGLPGAAASARILQGFNAKKKKVSKFVPFHFHSFIAKLVIEEKRILLQ